MATFVVHRGRALGRCRFVNILVMLVLAATETGCQMYRPVEFELTESQPSGTYVGDISKASGIGRDLSPAMLATFRYKFLNPNNLQTASLFSINSENSVIYTSAMIDRETICKFEDVCVISFDVTVTSSTTNYFQILTVRVNIKDINDNAPRFPSDEVTLFISEDASVRSEYKINGATDADKGPGNSVERYDLQSDFDTFKLETDRNLDGTWNLRIVTNSQLDREQRDHYRFLIVAKDGGRPPLSGTLTVNVNVTDANDNSPVFTQNVYDVPVQENALVGSVVGQVLAKDRDFGRNAEIEYRFSARRSSKVDELFFVDSKSGEIKVKNRLEYESGSSFETIVEASDSGIPPQVAQSILILRILDAGNDPPKIEINPVTDRTGGTTTLSEGAEIGLVVAHVQTTDKDQGLNGVVDCRSLDENFRVDRLKDRGYIVRVTKALDREAKQEHNVTIECQDSGNPPLAAAASFQIRLSDENDNNPRFERQIYRGNITERNDIGAFVMRVTARDLDNGKNAEVTYMISMEEEDSMFQINHVTGEITAAMPFDRETLSQVQFMVKAVDGGQPPRTGSASVIVDIVDKNDNAPYFRSSLEFEIPEKLEGGAKVGQLEAGDDDEGRNAEVQFMELTTDLRTSQVPFVVLSDGTINTDRMLIKAERDYYEMVVVVKDGGVPPLNTTATVRVRVIDSNDNPPIIEFPNRENNTVVISSDTKPGEVVTTVVAYDEDEGMNARLKYYIESGNEARVFGIPNPERGEIIVMKDLSRVSDRSYALKIEVQDQGLPQLRAASELVIKIDFVGGAGPVRGSGQSYANRNRNATATPFFGDEDLKYIIIAGVVGGLTVIISIIIVTIIIRLRRPSQDRRHRAGGVITGVQEQGDGRHFDKQLWHSVPGDDISSSVDEPEKQADGLGGKEKMEGEKGRSTLLAGNMAPDITDVYIKKHGGDQYGGQQLYTFRKCTGRAPSEDFQSDTSGETTASDSGRGESEEDIQLPPLPEMSVDTSRLVFAHGPEALSKERRFMYANTPHDPESISFETFSPRLLPSYGHHLPRDPGAPTAFRDVHTLGNNPRPFTHDRKFQSDGVSSSSGGGRRSQLPSPHVGQPGSKTGSPLKETTFGGKRVTFKNDLNAKNLQSLDLVHKMAPTPGPGPQEDVALFHGNDDRSPGGYCPSIPRSHDDDDTTTSGSYTLNIEDDLDDLPPPIGYSLA